MSRKTWNNPPVATVLHDLGECEVKHGVRVSIVNLSSDQVGNPAAAEIRNVQKRHASALGGSGHSVARARGNLAGVRFLVLTSESTLAAPEKSIAVLPFENLSEDQANAYFADGVQDEILTDLAKVADLKVLVAQV